MRLSRGRNVTVLVDSWVWIEYWSGGRHAREAAAFIEGDEEAYVSAINLAEVYFWVLRSYDEKTAQAKAVTMAKRCHVIPVEEETAVEGARLRMKEGLAMADSLVYATAREMGAKLVTGDGGLRHLPDVIFLAK